VTRVVSSATRSFARHHVVHIASDFLQRGVRLGETFTDQVSIVDRNPLVSESCSCCANSLVEFVPFHSNARMLLSVVIVCCEVNTMHAWIGRRANASASPTLQALTCVGEAPSEVRIVWDVGLDNDSESDQENSHTEG
jgi:hypothetical protein